MKKISVLFLILVCILMLAACGGPGGEKEPGKIPDVVPYHDEDAEFFCFIETVGGRFYVRDEHILPEKQKVKIFQRFSKKY